ncbi:sentrin-specific protease 1-like [Drosophila tropicalis]|uniref:sentrin-specific protease 1-like n=1 Tax=Drosophila tropicalis TaxID=46794 RepID=UPI0035ABB045
MSLHVDDDGFGLNTFDFVANETAPTFPPVINNIVPQFEPEQEVLSHYQHQQQQLEDNFLLFANAEQRWPLPTTTTDIFEDQHHQHQAILTDTNVIFGEYSLPSARTPPPPALINCHGSRAAVQQEQDVSNDPLLNCIRKAFTLIREICSNILNDPHQSGIESDINGILLLREKVIEVRKRIVARAFSQTTCDTWTVLVEIDREFEGLAATINRAAAITAAGTATNSENQEGSQMGLDLFNRLRHIFTSWQSGAKESAVPPNSEQQSRGAANNIIVGSGNGALANQGSARKRRNQDDGGNFKYRRVDNTFPKFITNEASEDYSSMSNHTMAEHHRDRMQRRNQSQIHAPQSQAQLQAQIHPHHQQDAANNPLTTTSMTRRSIFNPPNVTQTRVRNSNFNPAKVVIDLSDDDDEMPNQNSMYDIFGAGRRSMSRRDARDRDNCPMLTPSSLVRPQMLYSDAVRLGESSNGGFKGFPEMNLNGHVPHASHSLAQETTITGPASSMTDTLLMQEEQRSEHEQYLSLIQNLSHRKSLTPAAPPPPPPPQPRHKPRLPTLPPPPPLHRIPKAVNQEAAHNNSSSLEWYRLLNRSKPGRLHLNPTSSATVSSIEREQYAKLLDKGTAIGMGVVTTPPPPPLMRCNSATSATSHASTINSSSAGTVSSSSSSNSSSSSPGSVSGSYMTTKPKKFTTAPAPTSTATGGIGDSVIELDDDSNDERDLSKSLCTPKADRSSIGNKTLISPSSSMLQQTEALQRRFQNCIFFKDDFEESFNQKCARQRQESVHSRELAQLAASKTTEERRAYEQGLRENLSKYRMTHKPIFVIDAFQIASEEDKEPEFLPITDELQKRYNELIHGPPQQVLVSKFSLNITRNDIRTLIGSMWLNDEVINFYMNLLTDRSQRKAGKLPSVYAMNTFFVPRLLQNGHNGVKRWTRKVDLFSMDIIPVPVHVGGVHWCMAIIHMKNKTIRYYDSMGKPNQTVLNALESYLRDESLDKRKQPFDTSDFLIENVPNVPQQTNGSDCGVFSCMFAEYITRNRQLTFSQEHMEYFRKKMILEICGGELWL